MDSYIDAGRLAVVHHAQPCATPIRKDPSDAFAWVTSGQWFGHRTVYGPAFNLQRGARPPLRPLGPLVLARFVPVVRTFTPVLSGVAELRYRTFLAFILLGAALWSAAATLLGYGLGKRFLKIGDYLTPVIVLIVIASLVPVLVELRRTHGAART